MPETTSSLSSEADNAPAPQQQQQQQQQLVDFQDQASTIPFTRLLIILCALAFTLFVSFIDQTSVSTALPAIARSLNAFESISWAGTSFLVANTAFQLVNGRLSDIFGRRNCLLVCMTLFAIGDLLCGFAKSGPQLYAFRGIAGVGAGGINSLVMIIFTDMTTLQQRGKYQGLLETNIALGNGIGPLVGGAFAQSSATWRWTFWFIPPVAVAAGVGIFFTLPGAKMTGNRATKWKMIDYGGTMLSLAAVIFLLIPISSGGSSWQWYSALVISFLVIGCLLAVAFVMVEWKVARFPVMPLRLFERPAAKIMFTHNFLTGIVYYTDLYYLPLYFQLVLGHSPLRSCVLILPLILGFSAASSCAGVLLSWLGRYNPIIWTGYVLWTAGAGGCLSFDRTTSTGVTVGCLLIEGFGMGFSFQPVMIALLANTKKEDRAVVTGLRNFLRTIGGAIGLAISAAIINNVLKDSLPADMAGKAVTQLISSLDTLPSRERDEIKNGYMKALKRVFYLGCPLIGLCLLSSVALVDVPLATAHTKDQGRETVIVEQVELKSPADGQQAADTKRKESGIINESPAVSI